MEYTPKLTKPYSTGSYNKVDDTEQWIRITEGCPNNCPYCFEPREVKIHPIPEIVRNKVKIMDMNLLSKKQALDIMQELGSKKVDGKVVYYELICGIDYRFTTQELADALKQNRFKNIRLAWDWEINRQKAIKNCIQLLLKAGYIPKDITVFMICNWKISYDDNLRKLDLCKVWNVKVADCWFDNQLSPNIKPIHWNIYEIKDFRKRVRKHNQIVNFGIDPELDETGFLQTQAGLRQSLNKDLTDFQKENPKSASQTSLNPDYV